MIRLSTFALLFICQFAWSGINPLTMTISGSNEKVIPKANTEFISSDLQEKLKNPQETMRTFLMAMEKVKSGSTNAFREASSTLDLSQIDPSARQITGTITAERLINTLDRVAKINLFHIPVYETGPKWIFRKQTVTVGDNVYDVEIAIVKTIDGVWKFSPETVSSIENFYTSVANLKVVEGVTEYRNWRSRLKERMPAWASDEFLILKKGQWLGLIVLSLFSLAAFAFIRFIATMYLRYKVNHKSLDFLEDDQFKSTLPFGFLAFSISWLIGIRFLEFDVEMLEIFIRGSYIMTAVCSVWSVLKIVDYISLHFEKIAASTANKFDDVLVPMLKKTTKVFVVAFGAILVAHSLTFDVASILAGLGIGGVAVALAAKDTISNLFGSVTVIIDRPFQIGDYVSLEKNIEGTVEQVGFRSTRLRTPYNSIVTLPNSVLANMAIDNYGMRKFRRYKTFLQLEYSTPLVKIEEYCERIRYLIQLNALIQKETAVVSLYEMNSSSLDIMLTVFFLTDSFKGELSARHKFIYEILKLAEELEVKFAYPSQTIFLEQNKNLEIDKNL
ncbi:MAG: mechanosensitive ion channel family protein [Bacteriovorax sp.]|nr:mechanosensitive ion channel family protein [Bacteriovorax sp.]